MIHRLHRSQILHANENACWLFFSNPANLAKITPPSLDFKIIGDLPDEIYPGMMIEYRVRPLFGIPMTWVTEITHVERLRFFVDEQRVGPYKIWHHEHHFETLDGERIRMTDIVTYQLPFTPLSEPFHPLLVAPELQRIFDYRERIIPEVFVPPLPPPPSPSHGVSFPEQHVNADSDQ
jgi:ligand-binding SRPBCC domain-containing protein